MSPPKISNIWLLYVSEPEDELSDGIANKVWWSNLALNKSESDAINSLHSQVTKSKIHISFSAFQSIELLLLKSSSSNEEPDFKIS